MMNRKDKIVSAVGAPPPPRAPTVVETPELEDSAECAGGFDTDNISEGDHNGPEEPADYAPLHCPDPESISL